MDSAQLPRGVNRGLEMIVAASENDVIGRGNRLPWHLSADLRRFKALTLGRHILMGRRTYESIGRALPGRTNLVLTRSEKFAPADAIVVRSLATALDTAGAAAAGTGTAGPGGALMVIGGAQIYRECLPVASCIHLTLVHTRVLDGDTFFGDWRRPEWIETGRERHAADDRNDFAYSFVTLQRDPALSIRADG